MTMTDYSDLPNEINSNMEIYEVFGGKWLEFNFSLNMG